MSHVTPYPWERLESVPGRVARTARQARRGLPSAATAPALAGALGELLSAEVELAGLLPSVRLRHEAFSHGVATELQLDGNHTVAVWVEAALADALVARVLGRPAPLAAPDAPVHAEQRGALAALLLEALRRAGLGAPALLAGPVAPDGLGLVVRATLVLDGRPYRAGAFVSIEPGPTTGPVRVDLGELGDLPVSVPLVGATLALDRAEVVLLAPGDVLLPERWDAELSPGPAPEPRGGSLYLAAPGSSRGIVLACSPNRGIVLTGDVALLRTTLDAPESSMNDTEDTLVETVLDTPVVIQIEVGAVTLPAREWATLSPGDVLETGVHLGDPVVLRAAGVEVARGELVSVDGHVGVRILRITRAGRHLRDPE
jgi:flagellar motor switch/type III secretory pathway protein FliN